MRQLHLVGFTSDHEGIILAGRRGSKTGGYVVAMDEEFLEQLDHARRLRAGDDPAARPLSQASRPRVESALSPREMQTRLRAGRTVAQVAAEAGVAVEWVERFAAPVLAEQAAAVQRALATTMRTQRRGHSDRPLGPSVLRNLADRGVRLTDDEFDRLWSAFQQAGDEWVVRFRHRVRGRELDAEWVLDDGAGTLTPANRHATELGFVDPGRHAPPVKGLPPMRVLHRAVPAKARPPAAEPGRDSGRPPVSPAPARKAVKPAGSGKGARTANKSTSGASAAKKSTASKKTAKRAAGAGGNGSVSRRTAPVPRAGGNGSRRSRG